MPPWPHPPTRHAAPHDWGRRRGRAGAVCRAVRRTTAALLCLRPVATRLVWRGGHRARRDDEVGHGARDVGRRGLVAGRDRVRHGLRRKGWQPPMVCRRPPLCRPSGLLFCSPPRRRLAPRLGVPGGVPRPSAPPAQPGVPAAPARTCPGVLSTGGPPMRATRRAPLRRRLVLHFQRRVVGGGRPRDWRGRAACWSG